MNKFTKIGVLGLLLSFHAFAMDVDTSELSGNAIGDLPEFNEFDVPVVLTATRIQQHHADVPASVTIIDADLIKQLGVQSIIDLLRYVPGMIVAPENANNSDSVHYHGGSNTLPKNLQVLLNGRSMYHSGLAAVSWFEIPVAIEDIRRIEVVRGPNAATYGANSFQAVINILTKHPADTYGGSVKLKSGDNGEKDAYLRYGGRFGNSDYRASFVQKTNDGFGPFIEPVEGASPINNPNTNARSVQFATVDAVTALNQSELSTALVYMQSEKELIEQLDQQTNQNKFKAERLELSANWVKDLSHQHQLQVKSYTTQFSSKQAVNIDGVPVMYLDDDLRQLHMLNPAAANALSAFTNPTALLTSQEEFDLFTSLATRYPDFAGAATGVAGNLNVNVDEIRFDLEIQDTYVVSPALTLVSGVSFRTDSVDSQTYYGGKYTSETHRVFGSATWQASDDLSVHYGAMYEQETDLDNVFAPRFALNYKLNQSQSMRFVYSDSVRSPDLFEQQADWSLTLENPQPNTGLNGTVFFQSSQGAKNLDHQYIESIEIGYYGRLRFMDSELDVRVFKESLTDVYFQSLDIAAIDTFNDLAVDFTGIEWQISLKPLKGTQFRWNAAYVDVQIDNPYSSDEAFKQLDDNTIMNAYAKITSTLLWLQQWPNKINSSLSYILVDSLNSLNAEPKKLKRIDMRIKNTLSLYQYDVELAISAQSDISDDSYLSQENVYTHKTRVQLSAQLNF